MGAVMCISCETPGGRTEILRSWWAKTGITLIVKWWWVCCASLDDSCRNDCVRMWVHVNYVSQFPWCIVSRRSTLRPKSFKSYFTSGWIKKTSNGQSGQTFQFTHWHLWIRFWCPVTHGLSNNISISRHLSTAQVVLKVCASRWDQKSVLEFHGHHWVSTIYRSIATTLICYCMPACYGRNQVRRLSELMNTLSPGGFWVSWFANLSNCKPYLKTAKKWGEKRMPDWPIGGIISDEWGIFRTWAVYCYSCWFRGEAKNTCALLDSRRMNNTGTLPKTNTDFRYPPRS